MGRVLCLGDELYGDGRRESLSITLCPVLPLLSACIPANAAGGGTVIPVPDRPKGSRPVSLQLRFRGIREVRQQRQEGFKGSRKRNGGMRTEREAFYLQVDIHTLTCTLLTHLPTFPLQRWYIDIYLPRCISPIYIAGYMQAEEATNK